jgi:hypothetical protein
MPEGSSASGALAPGSDVTNKKQEGAACGSFHGTYRIAGQHGLSDVNTLNVNAKVDERGQRLLAFDTL